MFAVHFIMSFVGGALLCNSIPHLTAGLRGELFPSPFAKPRGIAPSAPEHNVLWGALNLFIGLAFIHRHVAWAGFVPGFVLCGWFLARYFGRVRAAGFQAGAGQPGRL
ncbi:hypothetical protein [Acidocella sp.]|uniref:hypothetical protein n=1 Tax=Acidocella sp. TaxID=50710 RepID=UPI0026114F97|nr:hypothetical protein [Acidocella sp.]